MWWVVGWLASWLFRTFLGGMLGVSNESFQMKSEGVELLFKMT